MALRAVLALLVSTFLLPVPAEASPRPALDGPEPTAAAHAGAVSSAPLPAVAPAPPGLPVTSRGGPRTDIPGTSGSFRRPADGPLLATPAAATRPRGPADVRRRIREVHGDLAGVSATAPPAR